MKIHLFIILCYVCAVISVINNDTTGPKHSKTVVCYMASWGTYLGGRGKFDVSDTISALPMCTHLTYLFVGLDPSQNRIKVLDQYRDLEERGGMGGIRQAVALRKSFPHLKIFVCLGGWNEGSENYSRMAKNKSTRKTFIDSVVYFLRKYQLDGIEINWQYPGDRGGANYDKENLVRLVKEMKTTFDPHGLDVSVAINCIPWRIRLGVNIAELSKYVSHISVLTYEYHGFWENTAGVNAPLTAEDESNVDNTITLLENNGADMSKLLLGVSSYGTTTLLTKSNTNPDVVIGEPAKNIGFRGPYHGADGFIAYNELCPYENDDSWVKRWHQPSKTPYLVSGDRFISYDDPQSISEKVNYLVNKEMGGIVYYSLDKDDFHGDCSSTNYTLLRAINSALEDVGCDLQSILSQTGAHAIWNSVADDGLSC